MIRFVVSGDTTTPKLLAEAFALGSSAQLPGVSGTQVLKPQANDTLAVQVYQNTGAALSTYSTQQATFANLTYLGL